MTRDDPPAPRDPLDGYELGRRYRRLAAESLVRTTLWWFAAVHGTFLAVIGLLMLGPPGGGFAAFLFLIGAWFVSLIVAAVAAGISLRNALLVRRRWLVLGLSPWLLLVAEVTFVVVAGGIV